MQNDNKFSYTYSAPTEAQRCEIESIRRQYIKGTDEETAEERLHRLHNSVISTATVAGLIPGVVGILVFGIGLTCVLEWNMLPLGIALSSIGAIFMIIAYPIYKSTLKKQKAKYGSEIIKLSDEILGKE